MLETLVTEKHVKEHKRIKIINEYSYAVIKNGHCFISILADFNTLNKWTVADHLPEGIVPATLDALYFTCNLNDVNPNASSATVMVGGSGDIQYITGIAGQYLGSIEFPIREIT